MSVRYQNKVNPTLRRIRWDEIIINGLVDGIIVYSQGQPIEDIYPICKLSTNTTTDDAS
jgi:hypothetical protein